MKALHELGVDLAARLPTVEAADWLTIRASDLPVPPAELTAPELVTEVVGHSYSPDYDVRVVDFFGSRRSYRHLGLLMLAQVLHRRPRLIRIRLAPRTVFVDRADTPLADRRIPQMLSLELPWELDASLSRGGLLLSVESFTYEPHERERFPFRGPGKLPRDVEDFPRINLTDPDGECEAPHREAVAARGFGNLHGTVSLAELMLDISQASSSASRFDLECEAGNRGVGPASHEMRFILPGAFEWLPRETWS